MHTDATGRTISKGSYIAYAVSAQSSSHLKFGIVVKLKEKMETRDRWNPQINQYVSTDEIKHSIQIVSVEKVWRPLTPGDYHNGNWEWVIQGKKDPSRPAKVQSLDRLERVVTLDPHQVLPEAKEVLDKEMHERGL